MTKCNKGAQQSTLVAVPEGGLWDAEQVAKHLGMSRAWVWKQVREGLGLPYVRLGGTLRFNREAVDAWVAAQSKGGEG